MRARRFISYNFDRRHLSWASSEYALKLISSDKGDQRLLSKLVYAINNHFWAVEARVISARGIEKYVSRAVCCASKALSARKRAQIASLLHHASNDDHEISPSNIDEIKIIILSRESPRYATRAKWRNLRLPPHSLEQAIELPCFSWFRGEKLFRVTSGLFRKISPQYLLTTPERIPSPESSHLCLWKYFIRQRMTSPYFGVKPSLFYIKQYFTAMPFDMSRGRRAGKSHTISHDGAGDDFLPVIAEKCLTSWAKWHRQIFATNQLSTIMGQARHWRHYAHNEVKSHTVRGRGD